MNILLIGHGSMGRAFEKAAIAAGCAITGVLTSSNRSDWSSFVQSETTPHVVVDFSHGSAVLDNVTRAMAEGLPIVEGTTGWDKDFESVRQVVLENAGDCVYGANFSPGVQALYLLVEQAAELLRGLPSYAPYISERHHHRKKDAPSGTARHLRGVLVERGLEVPEIAVLRAGEIPGTHEVGFDSEFDTLTLTHTARSRNGFAEGALMACRWIRDHPGFHEFKEILGDN